MPYPCYSYPATCYSYSKLCFSYPDDMPRGGGNPTAAQPPLPGMRRMPVAICFSYATHWTPPPHRATNTTCFRY